MEETFLWHLLWTGKDRCESPLLTCRLSLIKCVKCPPEWLSTIPEQSVRKMRGLQYIGAGLQYIGAPEFYFQNSGKDWGGRALIKPGFVYHMMAQLMNWKHFVCRVSCSKIKQKTCLLNRRGSNKLEPRLQYNGAHAPIYWSPSNIFLTQ